MQKYFNKIHSDSIKSQVEQYPFLCVTHDKIVSKCDISFREYLPALNDEKRSSGELWLDWYVKNDSYVSQDEPADKEQYIISDNNTYLVAQSVDLWSFGFIATHNSYISLMNVKNGEKKVFHSIVQSIKYQ